MNGEVKRSQRGGDFAGAQDPHRVPPAKAVKKELSVPAGRVLAILCYVIAKVKKKSQAPRKLGI